MKYIILAILPIQCIASWSGQWHAATWYEHFMPVEVINMTYNGYYPYWGYGLGMGRNLDVLAKQQDWQQIVQKLKQEKTILQNNPSSNRVASLLMRRIDLHLDGIS
jgi:hypothetical protein